MPVLEEEEDVDPETGEVFEKIKMPLAEKLQKFAEYYAGDPSAPTFRSATKSYMRLVTELGHRITQAGAERSGVRYLNHPTMDDLVDAVQKKHRVRSGMSAAQYIERCLEREAMLAERGGRGDSQAAVQYMRLAGTALGLLVQKTEDMTPLERKVLPLEDQRRLIIEAGERLARLAQPNPMPRLKSAEEIEVEVVGVDTPEEGE